MLTCFLGLSQQDGMIDLKTCIDNRSIKNLRGQGSGRKGTLGVVCLSVCMLFSLASVLCDVGPCGGERRMFGGERVVRREKEK